MITDAQIEAIERCLRDGYPANPLAIRELCASFRAQQKQIAHLRQELDAALGQLQTDVEVIVSQKRRTS